MSIDNSSWKRAVLLQTVESAKRLVPLVNNVWFTAKLVALPSQVVPFQARPVPLVRDGAEVEMAEETDVKDAITNSVAVTNFVSVTMSYFQVSHLQTLQISKTLTVTVTTTSAE